MHPNPHGFELYRPSIKGTTLLIKAIIISSRLLHPPRESNLRYACESRTLHYNDIQYIKWRSLQNYNDIHYNDIHYNDIHYNVTTMTYITYNDAHYKTTMTYTTMTYTTMTHTTMSPQWHTLHITTHTTKQGTFLLRGTKYTNTQTHHLNDIHYI